MLTIFLFIKLLKLHVVKYSLLNLMHKCLRMLCRRVFRVLLAAWRVCYSDGTAIAQNSWGCEAERVMRLEGVLAMLFRSLGNSIWKQNYYNFLLIFLTRLLVKLLSQNFYLTFHLGDASSKNIFLQGWLESLERLVCKVAYLLFTWQHVFPWMCPLPVLNQAILLSLRKLIRSLAKMKCIHNRLINYMQPSNKKMDTSTK